MNYNDLLKVLVVSTNELGDDNVIVQFDGTGEFHYPDYRGAFPPHICVWCSEDYFGIFQEAFWKKFKFVPMPDVVVRMENDERLHIYFLPEEKGGEQ